MAATDVAVAGAAGVLVAAVEDAGRAVLDLRAADVGRAGLDQAVADRAAVAVRAAEVADAGRAGTDRRGTSRGQLHVQFGEYGLKSLEGGWLTNRQIEAARVAMTRKIKRGGKVWINVFPDKPITKKPAETRMGSGKGSPEGWVAVVKPGRVMFELAGVPEPLAREAIRLAAHKLPLKSKFVLRED